MDHMRNVAHINPQILKAARARLGVTIEKLATRSCPSDRIRAWEDGDYPPTEKQAEWLAAKLGIPYLVLFLDQLPDLDSIPIPDLRTMSSTHSQKPSIDFVDTVNAAMMRQDWYREYQLHTRAPKLAFVGKYSLSDPVKKIAADIRSKLELTPQFRKEAGSWEEFNRSFIRQAEHAGILVMRNGVVEHSNRRKLSVDEFRGFAVSDSLAPLVFVNDRDARAAQNFTLAHEIAHIWIGQSGISNTPLGRVKTATPVAGVERFCNQIAAEVLVPEEEARQLWRSARNLNDNIRNITHGFRVSTLSALVRAFEMGFIEYQEYRSAFDEEWQRIRLEEERRKQKEQQEQKKQKGDFWATFKLRSSERFSNALIDGIKRDIASYKDAASLLGVSMRTVETFLHMETA